MQYEDGPHFESNESKDWDELIKEADEILAVFNLIN